MHEAQIEVIIDLKEKRFLQNVSAAYKIYILLRFATFTRNIVGVLNFERSTKKNTVLILPAQYM